MDLNEKELSKVWEMALDQLNKTIRNPRESNNTYMARCWTEGVIRALISSGYKVCISKDGKEILSQPSVLPSGSAV